MGLVPPRPSPRAWHLTYLPPLSLSHTASPSGISCVRFLRSRTLFPLCSPPAFPLRPLRPLHPSAPPSERAEPQALESRSSAFEARMKDEVRPPPRPLGHSTASSAATTGGRPPSQRSSSRASAARRRVCLGGLPPSTKI